MSKMSLEERIEEVQRWLLQTVAKTLEVPAFEIDVDTSLEKYGMDSLAAVHIVLELEKHLGRTLPQNLAYQHRTISALARYVVTTPATAA